MVNDSLPYKLVGESNAHAQICNIQPITIKYDCTVYWYNTNAVTRDVTELINMQPSNADFKL